MLQVQNDFGIDYAPQLPPHGTKSQNLKIISQTWNADRSELTLLVSGRAGHQYSLPFFSDGQSPAVEGGKISGKAVFVALPESRADEYVEHEVILRFAKAAAAKVSQ